MCRIAKATAVRMGHGHRMARDVVRLAEVEASSWVRHWADRALNEGGLVGLDCFLNCGPQSTGRISPAASDAKRFGECDVIWILQVGRDLAAAEVLFLNPLDIAI